MKRSGSPLTRVLDAFATALQWAVIVAMGGLVVVVLWGVASRYVSQQPSRWTDEAARYLLMWVALLGAAVAYRRGEHLGFDYFASRMDKAAQRILAMAAEVVVIGFAAFAMVYGGWMLVSKTLAAGQTTPALNIPMGYVYLAAPVSGILIVLFAVDRLWSLLAGDSEPDSAAQPSDPAPQTPPQS
ncbi:MAG: hypothetical protein CMJ58_10890 [Planctomycetaceae bacterium]|nr:hypothetical protein [Planctomycetaceae bacterium]